MELIKIGITETAPVPDSFGRAGGRSRERIDAGKNTTFEKQHAVSKEELSLIHI